MRGIRERVWSRWPLGLAVILVFAATIGAGYQWGGDEERPGVRQFRGALGGDGAPRADIAGFVTDANGALVTVRTGDRPVQLDLGQGAVLQGLEPIALEEVSPGDWVVVGGRDDNVNTFIVEAIVVMPPDQAVPPQTAEDRTP